MTAVRTRIVAMVIALGWVVAGCGAASGGHASTTRSTAGIPADLLAQARPIGRAPRFHPPARGPVLGPCQRRLGPRTGVHVELFAENRVVLVAAGIGVRGPLRRDAGRIAGAGCYGSLVTLEPTGVILMRPGARLTLADVFRSWGEPLSAHELAGFSAPAGSAVRLYVDGRRRPVSPGALVLTPHAEVVLEVGPYVPPHRTYTFPPGT
jgi:hypothetical protein